MVMLLCAAMSWSWSNPSQDEAIEAYEYYKSKYSNAAARKRTSERQEQTFASEKRAAKSEMNALSSQKLNLEKRLRGVDDIIRMLEGSGGWFLTSVPDAIEKAQSSIAKTDASFRSSMRLFGGSGAASLETAFQTKTVDADPHSASALSAFKSEKARLEEKIADLRTQIANLSGLIASLSNKIKACNSAQASLQASMNSYAYDMNHYKRYTY